MWPDSRIVNFTKFPKHITWQNYGHDDKSAMNKIPWIINKLLFSRSKNDIKHLAEIIKSVSTIVYFIV